MNQHSVHPDERLRTGLHWLLFAIRALATSLDVFLHHPDSFGERYFGPQSAASALLIFLFAALWPDYDVRPLLGFLGVYAGACVYVRLLSARRRSRGGQQPHSLYSGLPRIARILPRIDEVRLKAAVEPMCVCVLGLLVTAINEPLGVYLLCAGVALGLNTGIALALTRRRALDMHDVFIEQRDVAERFRAMRDE